MLKQLLSIDRICQNELDLRPKSIGIFLSLSQYMSMYKVSSLQDQFELLHYNKVWQKTKI